MDRVIKAIHGEDWEYLVAVSRKEKALALLLERESGVEQVELDQLMDLTISGRLLFLVSRLIGFPGKFFYSNSYGLKAVAIRLTIMRHGRWREGWIVLPTS
ncbi:hypothetical protein Tco_0441672 [Tanacetum coccineum]